MILTYLFRPATTWLATLLLLTGTTLQAQPPAESAVDSWRQSHWEEKVKTHIQYLAGDELAGRRTGTEGNRLAAEYIAAQFRGYGLQPLPGAKDYFHYFDYTAGVTVGPNNMLMLKTPRSETRGVKGIDFNPAGFSSSGHARGDLLFAGYGITADDLDYDDYKGVDARGRIIVVMRYTPDGASPHGDFSRYASFAHKVLNAREHEAAAIIFIDPSDTSLMGVRFDRNFNNIGMPVVFARSALFSDLRDKEGRTISQIRSVIDSTRKPASFVMTGSSASIDVDLSIRRAPVPNVVGVLPGTDPSLREEIIVIGAHFDHLGNGGEGSLYSGADPAIHHGADDNASGTAGMLGLAEIFAREKIKPIRRTMIFIAFNGEEEGLLGSASLVKDAPFDMKRVAAMINMDMIGRLDSSSLIVQGTGSSPMWEKLLSETNGDRFKLKFVKDGFGPSDHSSFYSKDIPVLFFFTGLHQDYHRPSDTWEKINYDGEAEVLGLVYEVVEKIDEGKRPEFTKVAVSHQGTGTGFKVYVGTIPDYAFDGKGLRLSGVAEGGPAQKAGLKEGDIIVKMGEKTINNIYDYTYALGDFRPKQKVEVEYLRDGKSEKTVVELMSR